ncbi:MAG: transposase, partial [Spirochaetota bacterium]
IKALFEYCIMLAQAKYPFELINYQIMDNHIHLLIRTVEGGATISRIVQYIKSRFAQRFNTMMQRTGPVWNERFKDSIVEFADNPRIYLLNLLWYFANNPVRAGKVKSPFESYFGGSKAYFDSNYRPSIKITLHQYFLELGDTLEECIACFLAYYNGELWL